ncbi:MAG: ATP-binding protein [Bacteroidetes bacterium]|nr:ATP-binding protein [Bacteroidota bacterium]
MEKEFNPFPLTVYKGPAHFCDREEETAELQRNIRNDINTTLFAIRRIGKTGLIHHVFDRYRDSRRTSCIYIDILGTSSLKEFCDHLATAIYQRFPEQRSLGKKIIDFIRMLRPVISYDGLSGQPEVSFETGEIRRTENTIHQLFNFLDGQKIKIVFAIDEFQQILEYPEKNTEALLRSCMQHSKNTIFIFSGSNQKMMHEIFNSGKRPFFASCSNLHLDYIDRKQYESFIQRVFRKYKRVIDPESISFIYTWTLGHTFYIQYFCNYLFSTGNKHIRLQDTRNAATEILMRNENLFYQYRNLITKPQWKLLTAIAKETRLYKPHAHLFIRAHGLGTSSMVTRSMEALLEKELIFQNTMAENPYYEVYDKFLMRWLQHF